MIRFPRKDADINALTQELVNHPAQLMVAKLCATDIDLPGGTPFTKLRIWLARAYAHGYVMGAEGISHKDAMPPTPDPLGRSQADVREPYDANDPRNKPPGMRDD